VPNEGRIYLRRMKLELFVSEWKKLQFNDTRLFHRHKAYEISYNILR